MYETNFTDEIASGIGRRRARVYMSDTRNRRDPRGASQECRAKTVRTISSRRHARTPTVTRSLFAREYLFIHPNGRCFSHAYVSRSRVVNPLTCNNLNSHVYKFHVGRRCTCVREQKRADRVNFAEETLDKYSLECSQTSPNLRKSEANVPTTGTRRKRPECMSTSL